MYPIERDRDIRELDVLIFGGIPEIPQPVFERDTYAYSELRRTRQAQLMIAPAAGHQHAEPLVLDIIRINVETGEFTVVLPATEEGNAP